jgi:hypothetical protein
MLRCSIQICDKCMENKKLCAAFNGAIGSPHPANCRDGTEPHCGGQSCACALRDSSLRCLAAVLCITRTNRRPRLALRGRQAHPYFAVT